MKDNIKEFCNHEQLSQVDAEQIESMYRALVHRIGDDSDQFYIAAILSNGKAVRIGCKFKIEVLNANDTTTNLATAKG